MKHTNLIRLGGLSAMVGGAGSAVLGLLYVLQVHGVTPGSIENALRKGNYENPVLTVLLFGVMAAVAALHAIQRRDYGSPGALASLAAFVGVAMTVGGNLMGELAPAMAPVAIILLGVGALAASFGVVGLDIITITVQVLPRWCGAAIIAGSPPAVGLGFMFLAMASAGMFWMLGGVPWMLVGYAIFRADSARQRLPSEQPSRVR